MNCSDCGTSFAHKRSLTRHQSAICRIYLLEKITNLEAKNKVLESRISSLEKELIREQKENELKTENNITLKTRVIFLEKELAVNRKESELAFERGQNIQLEKQTERLDRYEKHILESKSEPRNISINFNNLAPYDLTPERCAEICKEYTREDFLRSPHIAYDFVLNKHLTDENGKRRLACTDTSRQIFRGKTPDGTTFMDVGATRVLRDCVLPMKRAVFHAQCEVADDIGDDEAEKKKKKIYKILEQKRLTKRLAGDLR